MFDRVYLPCAEAQEGHPCAVTQLDVPDHRCVVHRVHFRHNGGEKTSAAQTVTRLSSSPFSSSTVSAVSTSFLLLCWVYFILRVSAHLWFSSFIYFFAQYIFPLSLSKKLIIDSMSFTSIKYLWVNTKWVWHVSKVTFSS